MAELGNVAIRVGAAVRKTSNDPAAWLDAYVGTRTAGIGSTGRNAGSRPGSPISRRSRRSARSVSCVALTRTPATR
jgi:hypothetical protein